MAIAIAIVFEMQYPWQYQYQLFVEYNKWTFGTKKAVKIKVNVRRWSVSMSMSEEWSMSDEKMSNCVDFVRRWTLEKILQQM